MLSRFHPILGRYGRTDRIAISISRVSVLMRDKNKKRNKSSRNRTYNQWMNWPDGRNWFVFTARRLCIVRTAPWQDVCLSVCPSHAGIVCKPLHISSKFFHLRGAPPFYFFRTKRYGNILTGTPITGASNARGVWKYHDFQPISGFISELMQ